MATLHYSTKIKFNNGSLSSLSDEIDKLKINKPLICTDKGIVGAGILEKLKSSYTKQPFPFVYDETPSNPTESSVKEAATVYLENECDGLIAIGGGSAIDLTKAVGLMVTHSGALSDYSVVENGVKKINSLPPIIAIPTTSGTGSEVSNAAMVTTDDGRKLMLLSKNLIPSTAICDPELTIGLPPGLTAATGMDAVTHCIEAILSPVIDPPAEAIALDGLDRVFRVGSLDKAVNDGADISARWQLMMASLEGALAFVKGLGAVHAMSHSAGRLKDLNLHHGTLNAVLLPVVMRFNYGACKDKFSRIKTAMHLNDGADVIEEIESLNERLGMPKNLSEMGISESMIPGLVEHSLSDICTRTNPKYVGSKEYENLFYQSLR